MFSNLALMSLSILLAVSALHAAESEPQVESDYEASRKIFRTIAGEIETNPLYGASDNRPRLKKLKVEYPDMPDEDLTMDALIIPARKQKTLVVQINSGIHGLEAPTGSYLQQHFLMKCLPSMTKEMLDQTTFVITHALNPWGFKHASRFNANNVDLNRNCGGAHAGGEFNVCYSGKTNAQYGKLKPVFDWLIQSNSPISTSIFGRCTISVGLAALWYGRTHPSRFVEKALAGQTQDRKGIYFAGTDLQPECKTYQNFSQQFYDGKDAHQNSLTYTWHTGYGELGHLQYMGNPSDLQSPKLVDVLKRHMTTKNDDLTTLDFRPTFATCNDENVWLRNVEPSRGPNKLGASLNAYLTAEIGGKGNIASICAVLMSEQLTGERAEPLFEAGSKDEKNFKDQIFEVFNPIHDEIYMRRLSEHAQNSCNAIKGYIEAVLHP